jgi:hypothetical protein
MPLKLTLGLSKKIGEPHYGSRGASLYLEVEVDSLLLKDSDRLRDQVRTLYSRVRTSLLEELYGRRAPVDGLPPVAAASETNGVAGHDSASVSAGSAARPATPLQVRAIERMATEHKISLPRYLETRAAVLTPANLTLSQASQIIVELRTITAPERFAAPSPDETLTAATR